MDHTMKFLHCALLQVQGVAVLLLLRSVLQVHATELCDGYFHKADCLASETGCGWKGCM